MTQGASRESTSTPTSRRSAGFPGSGPNSGGTTVTISGSNFTGATAVSFRTIPATSFTVQIDATIIATAPPWTDGTVDVTVTDPAGTSAIVPADQYTYTAAAPVVTSVSPATGPVGGGRSVTITGTGFYDGTSVSFGRSEPDLSWLADAPVFIDGQQIGAFYDAVVGRTFRAVQLQLSAGQTEQLERSAGGSLNAGSSALFSWLKFDVGAEARRTRSRGARKARALSWSRSRVRRCGWCN